jgi:hypothetical protein
MRRITAAVLVVAAAAAVLTGCGGDDDALDGPILRPAATTDSGPFAGQSADDVLSTATAAMKSTAAVRVNAFLKDDDDQDVHLSAAMTHSDTCAAAVAEGADSSFQIIGIGETYYLKADADYWRDSGGADGDTLARALAGKWAKLPAEAADDFDGLCRVGALLDPSDGGPVTRGAATTAYGRPVVPLRQRDDDGTVSTAYVAATGTPYVLGIADSDGYGRARFTDFGKVPKISAPPAADTVDFSSVTSDDPSLSV